MSQIAPPLEAPPAPQPRLARWRHALSTVNPPEGQLDAVSKWLVITRAGVLPMTLTATGRYLARAAWEEGKILARRQPIATIVADTTVPAKTRIKLQLVLDARAVIPLHHDGWGHFTQDLHSLQSAFADAGLADRLVALEPGESATI